MAHSVRKGPLTVVAHAAVVVLATASPAAAQTPPDSAAGFSGDGGPAAVARLSFPTAVTVATDGSYLIADTGNNRIRRVGPDRTIATVAGDGRQAFAGDGGAAVLAALRNPQGVATTPDGGYLIADTGNHRVRKVSPVGAIATVAGTGEAGLSGDGGPAIVARLDSPAGVAALPDGGFLIADSGNDRIRRVAPDGTIDTVAGGGTAESADDGAATDAVLNGPTAVVGTGADFVVADTYGSRVRAVSFGRITTVAGTGNPGFGGDGGPGDQAGVSYPSGLALQPDGTLLVADKGNQRVRRLSPRGLITTVAGSGETGYGGDGPATAAPLASPAGVAAVPGG